MTTNSHIKNPTEEVLREAKRQLAIRAAEIVVVQAAERWHAAEGHLGWDEESTAVLAEAVAKLKEARQR